ASQPSPAGSGELSADPSVGQTGISTETNAYDKLKRLIDAQQAEINALRANSASTALNKPTQRLGSGESEAKDLLKKVKFSGKHFSAFKLKFQNICQLRHIWDIIVGKEATPGPDAPEVETFHYDDKVNIARSYLQTCLSDEVFELVREDESPAEMWKTLIANYETKEWSNTIYTLRRLGQLRYEPKSDMMRHIGRVRSTIRELNDMGKVIDETETVEWILMSLPDSGPDNFNNFLNHLKPTPDHKVTLKSLISALLNEEEKRKERGKDRRHDRPTRFDFQRRPSDGKDKRVSTVGDERNNFTLEINALQAKVDALKTKQKLKGNNGNGDHWCFICRQRGDHVAQDHADYDPNFASKRGRQSARTIPTKRKAHSSGSETEEIQSFSVNSTYTMENDDPLCGTVSQSHPSERHWTLDNCATGHVTGTKDFIDSWHGSANLILPNKTQIRGNVGVTNIAMSTNGKLSILQLRNVTYAPSLYKNLISHIKLLESGYRITRQDMQRTIYKHPGTNHRLTFTLVDNLYVLDDVVHSNPMSTSISINANITQDSTRRTAEQREVPPAAPSDTKLLAWHNKLNHTDLHQVARIIKPILKHGEDLATSNHICTGCAQGQAKRMSFRNTHHYVAPRPLERLNADLCGPIRPQTVNHEIYTSMFIDQASRFVFGRLLKKKDATITHLDELTTLLDNQLPDARIGTLYTDGGGEYTGATFKAACLSRGILQKFTNAECPEENHLAEKTNEFVFNKIRVYLTLSGLPTTLWGFCFKYVVHVYNNTPQELLNNRTPYEVLYCKPSRLYMLKTFGCLAYKFVPKTQRPSKLSNPAVQCVFLGYADHQLGYVLWEPKSRTVTVSRSVKFDETQLQNGSMFSNADFNHGRLSIPQYRSIQAL
ncbi:hypothetical protein DYB32_009452, partial [Aphanomyces invadans]